MLWVSDIQPKVLIYTTHIKKVIAKLYSFTLRSKITDKTNRSEISQRSEISLDTHRATETYLTERFVTALEAEPQVYYRRILNTICSLGTTLLQSGTLIPKMVKPR